MWEPQFLWGFLCTDYSGVRAPEPDLTVTSQHARDNNLKFNHFVLFVYPLASLIPVKAASVPQLVNLTFSMLSIASIIRLASSVSNSDGAPSKDLSHWFLIFQSIRVTMTKNSRAATSNKSIYFLFSLSVKIAPWPPV